MTNNSLKFEVQANWGYRQETPEGLAVRLGRLFDRLAPLDPRLRTWYWRRPDHPEQLMTRTNLASIIAQGVHYDDDREVEPLSGFGLDISNRAPWDFSPDTVAMGFCGSRVTNNHIELGTLFRVPPPPDLVAYRVLREVMLAVSDCFEPDYAFVEQSDVASMKDYKAERDYVFPVVPVSWMADLPPRLARHAIVPPGVIAERRANGNLFLAATDEDFDFRNPTHVAAAWTLYSVLHPLNMIPRDQR